MLHETRIKTKVPHMGSFLSIFFYLFLNSSASSTHIFSLVANELSVAGILLPVRHGPLQWHEVAVVNLKTSHKEIQPWFENTTH